MIFANTVGSVRPKPVLLSETRLAAPVRSISVLFAISTLLPYGGEMWRQLTSKFGRACLRYLLQIARHEDLEQRK